MQVAGIQIDGFMLGGGALWLLAYILSHVYMARDYKFARKELQDISGGESGSYLGVISHNFRNGLLGLVIFCLSISGAYLFLCHFMPGLWVDSPQAEQSSASANGKNEIADAASAQADVVASSAQTDSETEAQPDSNQSGSSASAGDGAQTAPEAEAQSNEPELKKGVWTDVPEQVASVDCPTATFMADEDGVTKPLPVGTKIIIQQEALNSQDQRWVWGTIQDTGQKGQTWMGSFASDC